MRPNSKLKPTKEFRTSKINLPHFELPGRFYFITFSTIDRFTLSDPAKDIVLSSFHFHNGKKYLLHTCIIMDDHVHCILQPQIINNAQAGTPVPLVKGTDEYYGLAQITHSIKSYSANRIQKLFNLQNHVWQDENFDRIIRDEKEYRQKINYIRNNAPKIGLVENPEDYKWLYIMKPY
jgi:putative transposase